MKEARKGTCSKCGKKFYLHRHHILSKAIFGNDGEKEDLCPNCHTHFHEYSKKETTDPTNKEEAMKIWVKWFKTVSIIVTIWLIGIWIHIHA